MISNLECATAPRVFAFVSAPIDTPHHQPHSSARSLRNNSLGHKGAAALAEGLKGNSTLQLLRLSGSNLTNNGRDVSGLVKLVEVLPQTKIESVNFAKTALCGLCLLYTSPSPRDKRQSRMPSSA